MIITSPVPTSPLVDENGQMSDEFQTWILLVSQASTVFTGTGSPEGVIEALPEQRYMDTAGTAGNIWYVKRDADVGGDKSQGWINVG